MPTPPQFRPRDLAPPQFDRGPTGLPPLALSRTEGVHLAGAAAVVKPVP